MTTPVRWFATSADHRPRLHCLGAVDEAWQLADGLAVSAHGHLWLPVADQVAAIKVQSPISLVVEGDRCLIRDGSGRTIRRSADHLEVEAPTSARVGWKDRIWRADHQWTGDRPLLLGARSARRIEPLPTEAGVVWADGGWIYLQRGEGPPVVVGPIGGEEVLRAGPAGRILVGEPSEHGPVWTRLCRADQPPMRFSPPACDTGLRWSPDGSALWWLEPGDATAWRTDLTTGQGVRTERAGLPTGGEQRLDPDEGSLSPPQPGDHAAQGAIYPQLGPKGRTLAGPGTRLWDLDAGLPCSPPMGPGLLLPPDRARGPWSHLAPDGALREVVDGRIRPLTHLDDARQDFVSGWRTQRAHILIDDEGEAWRLGSSRLRRMRSASPPDPTRAARTTGTWRALVPWHFVRGEVAWAWNHEGLLLAFPEVSVLAR